MSRQDQFVGLSSRAQELIRGCGKKHYTGKADQYEVVSQRCSDSLWIDIPEVVDCVKVETGLNYVSGMFDKEYQLKQHTLRSGTVYQETTQAVPWSSGPVIFTCLEDEDRTVVQNSMWTEEEMEAYL